MVHIKKVEVTNNKNKAKFSKINVEFDDRNCITNTIKIVIKQKEIKILEEKCSEKYNENGGKAMKMLEEIV